MKYIYSLLFAALLAFLAWPYYRIYQIDDVLGHDNPQELAPLVDLPAVRAGVMQQLDARMKSTTGQAAQGSVLDWLHNNLRKLGSDAADEIIDLQWVREALQRAARQAIAEPPYYLIKAIDHAFFDSYDSFLIRLGPLDQNPTHVRMQLRSGNWRITGIYN
ncbi:MAG: DUF2939 domain-containing protein [Gammaproteobacteria bacterium]